MQQTSNLKTFNGAKLRSNKRLPQDYTSYHSFYLTSGFNGMSDLEEDVIVPL